MIKLLHTGDIHLDSAFSGLDSRSAEIRRNELRSAFTSMITYARMNNADLIIIAGDLFDSEYVTKETISILRREFESFAKPIFIAPGNHDPASQKSIWHKKIFRWHRKLLTDNNNLPFLIIRIWDVGQPHYLHWLSPPHLYRRLKLNWITRVKEQML